MNTQEFGIIPDSIEWEEIDSPVKANEAFVIAVDSLAKGMPERHLDVSIIMGIIVSAGKTKDKKYFEGPEFTYHCDILGLDVDFLRENILDSGWIDERKVTKPTKITLEQREEIIKKFSTGKYTQSALAREYDMWPSGIANIVKK